MVGEGLEGEVGGDWVERVRVVVVVAVERLVAGGWGAMD